MEAAVFGPLELVVDGERLHAKLRPPPRAVELAGVLLFLAALAFGSSMGAMCLAEPALRDKEFHLWESAFIAMEVWLLVFSVVGMLVSLNFLVPEFWSGCDACEVADGTLNIKRARATQQLPLAKIKRLATYSLIPVSWTWVPVAWRERLYVLSAVTPGWKWERYHWITDLQSRAAVEEMATVLARFGGIPYEPGTPAPTPVSASLSDQEA